MQNFLKTLKEKTIWSAGAIPVGEWKYRNLKRVLFPSYDFLMLLAGLSCFYFGVPTLLDFYPLLVVQLFGILFAIASVLALIGISFPARWRIEIFGMSVTLGLVIIYLFTLVLRTFVFDTTRLFAVFFVAATITVIVWRLSLLGNEWQDRRLNEKH